MALEAAKFDIVQTTFDKEKRLQKYLYPLYWLIKLVTVVKGERGIRNTGSDHPIKKTFSWGATPSFLYVKNISDTS